MKKYGWNLKDPPDYDLTTRRRSGSWDIVSGIDGWTVYTPHERWSHNGIEWHSGPFNAPPRGKVGAVTREDARAFAESLIDEAEKR